MSMFYKKKNPIIDLKNQNFDKKLKWDLNGLRLD